MDINATVIGTTNNLYSKHETTLNMECGDIIVTRHQIQDVYLTFQIKK